MTQELTVNTDTNNTEATSLAAEYERIAALAFALWQDRGRPEGSAEVDWLQAEQKLAGLCAWRRDRFAVTAGTARDAGSTFASGALSSTGTAAVSITRRTPGRVWRTQLPESPDLRRDRLKSKCRATSCLCIFETHSDSS